MPESKDVYSGKASEKRLTACEKVCEKEQIKGISHNTVLDIFDEGINFYNQLIFPKK